MLKWTYYYLKHIQIERSRKYLFPTVHGQSRCMALFPNASLLVSHILIAFGTLDMSCCYSRNNFHVTIFFKLHVVASCSMFLNIYSRLYYFAAAVSITLPYPSTALLILCTSCVFLYVLFSHMIILYCSSV